MNTLRALTLMARPLILPSGVLAYALGTAMAYGKAGVVAWVPFWIGLALTLLANLAAHYVDEYADADTDVLAQPTGMSGGSGALAAGLGSRRLALTTGNALSALTVLLGAYAVAIAAIPAAGGIILLLGLAGGWAYSMPPLALERRGLGEIANAVLGGLLMPLMGYTVQSGIPPGGVYLSLTATVAAVMVCVISVHWADRRADAAVGKRTLAVIYGERVRFLLYGCSIYALGLPLLLLHFGLPGNVALWPLAATPLALFSAMRFTHGDSPAPGAATMAAIMSLQLIAWVYR
jgi:1,4-dihydroxy-2-naphthoate polyprenyltransferase